jgi:Fe-Mn family superoxide dismutase
MPYEATPPPYSYDALEPHIDARTMEIHHSKHHAGYATNLNKALEAHAQLASRPVEQLLADIKSVPEDIRQAVINNAGGVVNHNFFWQIMGPHKGGAPRGRIADDIKAAFGAFDAFKEQLTKAATTRFGSGWGWLVRDGQGRLQILSTANQDSPLMQGQQPVIGVDVWEHAYYLKYQNRRPDYLAAWWNVVNWDAVAERYDALRK